MKIYKQEASGRTTEVGEDFNWAVFFFGFIWYAYKGMWGLAFVNFLVAIILSALFGLWALFYWVYMGLIANGQYEDYLISKGWHVVK